MRGLEIRNAREDDHATFLSLSTELGIDDRPPSIERWSAQIRPTTIIAEREGEIAGYAYYRLLNGAGHLAHVVSAPAARRTGVGRALIEEVIARVRAHGGKELFINTKPSNTAALALYESFGIRPWSRSWALRMPWEAALAETAPHVAAVREPRVEEDAALEELHQLPPGVLANQRARGYCLRVIDRATIASFDPSVPGAYPFCAESSAHAFSMLHALRSLALPEYDFINLSLENQPELREALLAAGATLRIEIVRLRGAI